MQITKISVGLKKTGTFERPETGSYCLYLFRSPVIMSIGGVERVFGGSTAVISTPGRRHRFRGAAGKTVKYDMIYFRLSTADKQYLSGMDIPLNTPIELADEYMTASAIKNLSIQKSIVGSRKAELGELYLRIIFISLESAAKGIKPEEQTVPRYAGLKEIRSEIYEDPMSDWTVDDMCRRLAVSRTYFHRIYLEAFGVTFRQDVIESRINYAAELLLTTELSVSAVAEKCGYESDSYFMRQFKQHRGCTPSEYRNIAAE